MASLAVVPILLAGPAASPHLASAAATAPVALGAEAWYSSPKICVIPQICLPVSSPVATTYPPHTLHIAAAGGAESARAYLSLRKPLAATTTVTGGTLRLPLDISPADGSVAPDLARVQLCTTQVRIKPVDGSTATPPAVNCTHAPISRVVGTPATELDIDLRPIAARLAKPRTSLALLPVLSSGATWHVTVSSNLRHRPATTPVLILTTTSSHTGPPPSPTDQPAVTPDDGNTAVPPVEAPPAPVDLGPQVSELPPGSVSEPQIAPNRPAAFRVSPHSFDYPVVFLVPLLILAGLIGFGRQLTRPVTRRHDG